MESQRILGRTGIPVSAMGLGCWAIGGPFWLDGKADGWGAVDDQESIRAVHLAMEAGINFFDSADVYGAGHSETVLGQALKGRRHQAVIATKFGYTFDPDSRRAEGCDVTPDYIRRACEASLRRLDTDYIDLYLLHVGMLSPAQADEVAQTLQDLQALGRIRAFGWSTDDPGSARRWTAKPHFCAVEHDLNLFHDASELIAICDIHSLASINRTPLAMGLLSGKFNADSRLPVDDVRGSGHEWVAYFENGRPRPEFLERLAAVREILTSKGRSLTQGALAWIWGRSPRTIPIPGFKTATQVEENVKAMDFGPLSLEQMQEIERLLSLKPGKIVASA
ncbi:aryl-alcohol dehydrogenase-like predicted oxidoreductase [Hydrogenispora ethanolica]|uniref:Aryl-alcohol dehydrogenase-like predicted oxidoreductase n=1 Tax=Hydrogenispora ethanolica TaxID=1082276 RepID=A0A4R1S7B1_HYDET|nr:aldo/keto reductase [Hydrogenispora ethanolica]TCL75283.1 aryl-alcohol dehydrogenase-like predicted oxidoreductase [Hydrogenispora ethanolica]